jgi:O-antigen ligase
MKNILFIKKTEYSMLFNLKNINKILVLITIVSIMFSLQKGSFTRNFIPNAFQISLVLSLIFTAFYVLKNNKIKDFFMSVPKKILLAIGIFYSTILLGWGVALVFLDIPTTLHTILDFGTFTMGMALFFLVSFYAKDDKRYAGWCLFALFIPNAHLLYFFITHGFVGYWGVPTDGSLDYVLDPNILSKTLLVPALFFISMSLYSLKDKNWRMIIGYMVGASVFSLLVFWTVSRGASLSLLVGSIFIWFVFSFKDFTWKKFISGGVVLVIILSTGHALLRNNTKQAIYTKASYTVILPDTVQETLTPANENISFLSKVKNVPNITKEDIKADSRIDLRFLIWYFYPQYIIEHPLGIGPNASWDFGFTDKNGSHIYVGPDSTYLVVGLWGGILGIISYLYIIGSAVIDLFKKWRTSSDAMSLVLLGILFTLSAALFFDGMLSLYAYYIVLALSFIVINTPKQNEH